MKEFIIDTITHFPGCFAACVLSHWMFDKLNKLRKKGGICDGH